MLAALFVFTGVSNDVYWRDEIRVRAILSEQTVVQPFSRSPLVYLITHL